MKIVKLSVSPWLLTQEEFNYYTPNGDGIVGQYKFEVNNDCNRCDFWIVRGGIPHKYESVKCPRENLIFIQDEVYDERTFSVDFLKQFGAVVGLRKVVHPRYIWHCEMLPWFFVKKKYNDLIQPVPSEFKTRNICLMTSDATWIEGHRVRYAFSNQLIGHFKDRLDVYGRGFKSFDCKYEVLKNYKYCIALENTAFPGYFTEKINECFLSEAFPVYYGCPDIFNYYEEKSLTTIDAKDYKKSIIQIEQILEEDIFEARLDLLRKMKQKYLVEYHWPIALTKMLDTNFTAFTKPNKQQLLNESFFSGFKVGKKHFIAGMKMLTASTIGKIRSI